MDKRVCISSYATVHRSGAVTVDLVAYLKSPAGQQSLKDMTRLKRFVRSKSAIVKPT